MRMIQLSVLLTDIFIGLYNVLNRTIELVNRVNHVFNIKKCSILVFYLVCFIIKFESVISPNISEAIAQAG
jgi:hypothetical protein